MKNKLYLTIIILIAAITITITARAQISIDPGQCYTQNFYSGINDTKNLTYEYCADSCPNSTQFINLELWPGQSDTYSQGYCNITYTCNLGNSTSTKCKIDDTAEPGTIYKYNTESCDVTLDVDSCEAEKCTTELPTEYEEELEAKFDGDKFRFEFAGKEYVYTIKEEGDFNVKVPVTFQCPTTFAEENTSADDILTQCKSVVPVYCTDMTKILINRFDSCQGRMNSLQDELKNCNDVRANSVCVESKAYAELIAGKGVCENSSQECNQMLGAAQQKNMFAENNNGILVALLMLSAIINGVSIYIIKKKSSSAIPKGFRRGN